MRLVRIVFCAFVLLLSLDTRALAAQSVEALQAPSNEHFRLGKFDDAVVQYQKVLASHPDDPNALYWLGRTLLKKDDVQSAYDLAAKGCNKHPANGHLRSLLGDALFRIGEFDDAKTAYQNAINLDVNLARGHLGLGKVLKTESRYKSALPHLRKAYELDPKDPDVIRQWASVLKSSEEEVRLWEAYVALATNEDDFSLAAIKSEADLSRRTGFKKRFVLKGEPRPDEIKLQALKDGPREAFGLGLKVRINGDKQLTLHLDTGASGLLLHQRAAEKSGVQILLPTQVRGLGNQGAPETHFAWADSIQVGELEFNNCVVKVTKKRLFADTDGWIGTDVFANFLIHLNYPKRLLKLAPLPHRSAQAVPSEVADRYHFDRFDDGVPPETANLHPIRVLSGTLFLPTVVNQRFRSHFIIDSGGSHSIISTKLAEQTTNLARDASTVAAGVSGRVRDVYRARTVTLQFASFRQQNPEMLSMDFKEHSKIMGTEIGGLIGHTTLQHFTLIINYRDGVVGFLHHDR